MTPTPGPREDARLAALLDELATLDRITTGVTHRKELRQDWLNRNANQIEALVRAATSAADHRPDSALLNEAIEWIADGATDSEGMDPYAYDLVQRLRAAAESPVSEARDGMECPMCGGGGRIFDITGAIEEAQAAGRYRVVTLSAPATTETIDHE